MFVSKVVKQCFKTSLKHCQKMRKCFQSRKILRIGANTSDRKKKKHFKSKLKKKKNVTETDMFEKSWEIMKSLKILLNGKIKRQLVKCCKGWKILQKSKKNSESQNN